MASSGLGDSPLLGGSRFARAATPGPVLGSSSPATVDAIADYVFGAAAPPATAELQANRLPDADGGFRWTLQWHTNVMAAINGLEQRVAVNGRSRDRYDGAFILNDIDMRYVRSLLSRTPATLVELPMPHEAVAALETITAGTIVVDTDYADWAIQGRRLYIVGPAGDAYSTTITGVNGDTLNVNSSPPPGGSFPASSTFVYPLESVYLEEGQPLGRYPVSVGKWQFQSQANEFRLLVATGATPLATFDGFPVLHRRPVSPGIVQEKVYGGVQFVDEGGVITALESFTRSKHQRTHEWLITSPAERQWWKLFLATMRGRLKPFLLPTWTPDLPLTVTPVAGADTLTTSIDYAAEWFPSLAHRRLQIEYADGSVTYNEVDSAATGGGVCILTLTLDLPDPLPAAVSNVSFLETVRLDSDEISIEYGAGWLGRIQLSAMVVQDT